MRKKSSGLTNPELPRHPLFVFVTVELLFCLKFIDGIHKLLTSKVKLRFTHVCGPLVNGLHLQRSDAILQTNTYPARAFKQTFQFLVTPAVSRLDIAEKCGMETRNLVNTGKEATNFVLDTRNLLQK